jgi:hypothetical protein
MLSRAPMRLALALTMLLAFTLQSYVTQTHIHIGSVAVTAGVTLDKHAGKPLDNETTNCLFCQEMLHAGAFVTPAATVLPLPVEYSSILRLDLALPLFIGAIPHGWQGRGPPRN